MAKADEAARVAEALGVETEKAGDLEKLRSQKQKRIPACYRNPLISLVGTRGFEPRTPTVSG
jgi:hypothetical protein